MLRFQIAKKIYFKCKKWQINVKGQNIPGKNVLSWCSAGEFSIVFLRSATTKFL